MKKLSFALVCGFASSIFLSCSTLRTEPSIQSKQESKEKLSITDQTLDKKSRNPMETRFNDIHYYMGQELLECTKTLNKYGNKTNVLQNLNLAKHYIQSSGYSTPLLELNIYQFEENFKHESLVR